MMIPCLCSFKFTVPSSLSTELVGVSSHLLTQTVLSLESPTGAFIASLHSVTANLR